MPATVDPVTGQLDALLTNYSTGYRQNGLISDILFPRVPVGKQGARYVIFKRESEELLQQDLRKKGSGAQQIVESLSSDSYYCDDHSLAAVIAADDQAGSEIGDLRQRRARTIMAKLLLAKEKRAIDLISSTSSITNYDSLDDAAEKWSDADNSDPLGDVDTGKDSIRKAGVEPNIMIISPALLGYLRAHSELKEAFKYTTPGSIGVPQLQSYFGIERVLVAAAVTVSKAGAATYLMGNHALLAYVDSGAGAEDPSFGKTFVWTGAPAAVGGMGTVVGPIGVPSALSEEVSTHFWYDQKVVFVDGAYLIANAA